MAIEFLNWLPDHGITLEELRQEHLDAWLADGPSTRRFIDRFIPLAIKCMLGQRIEDVIRLTLGRPHGDR